MKNILTLTDFKELSNQTIQFALKFAMENDSKLYILHKLEDDEWFYFDLSGNPTVNYYREEKISKNQYLQDWQNEAIALGVEAQLVISADPFVEAVQDMIRAKEIDLIVMGTTSEYERSDSHWYSKAQLVVKEVNCPVLVLKEGPVKTKFTNIVYASSFNLEDREPFLYYLKNFFPGGEAKLHLLAIDTVGSFSELKTVMQEVLQDFQELARPYNVESTFYSDFSVDSGIKNFINESKPDLLVMSNKIKKPLKQFFQGNHILWNLARIDCPILTMDYPKQEDIVINE